MSLSVSFHGVVLLSLGAFSFTQIAQSVVNQAQLGIVALIGESDAGPAWAAETTGIKAVTFSPTQFGAIQQKYGSGPLVDAARLALSPSNDPLIQGGAQQLILMKTNQSVKASLTLSANYGTIKAKSEGTKGNNVNVTVAQTYAATTTAATTNTQPTITVTSATGIAIGQMVTGTGIPAGAYVINISGTTVTLSTNATATNASTSVKFGFTSTITVNRTDTGTTEISSALGGTQVMSLQCTDGAVTSATLSISSTAITTAITGGATSALNIPIGQFKTIADLVAYINTISNYSAAVVTQSQALQPPSVLDQFSGLNIKQTTVNVTRDAADVQTFFATSQLVDFTPGSAGYLGQPQALAKTFLASGARGATTQAQFQACLDALAVSNCNFIVPLFSQDATADITAGVTDSSSSYVATSIHSAVRSHCVTQSAIKARKERQAWVGYQNDTFTNVQNQSATIGSGRVSLCFQPIDAQLADGTIAKCQPHMLAVIAAGMKAGAPVGLPNTFKKVNCNAFYTLNSTGGAFFDPETDRDTAIASNLTFVEAAPGGGIRFHVDNSTYGAQDGTAWFWSRPAVVYAGDVSAKTIRLNTELFIGTRNSDVNATTVVNFLVGVLDKMRSAGIIVADKATGGKGYSNLQVSQVGNTMYPSVSLALVEANEWVLNDIAVQRSVF